MHRSQGLSQNVAAEYCGYSGWSYHEYCEEYGGMVLRTPEET